MKIEPTRDPGPMARFEALKADAGAPTEIFLRLTEGETLRELASAWALPRGVFTRWFSTVHAELYDAALKVRADELAQEAVSIADKTQPGIRTKTSAEGVETVEEDMLGHRKLQVDTRLKLIEKWDRARYGSKDAGPVGGITVIVDRSCGGTVEIEAGGAVARIPLSGGAEASVLPAKNSLEKLEI